MEPSLDFRLDNDGRRAILALKAELDMANVPQLKDSIDRAVPWEDVDEIVFDLRDLDFMDSSGLSALIWLREQHPKTGIRIVVPGDGIVKRLFDITAMHELFAIDVLPRSA